MPSLYSGFGTEQHQPLSKTRWKSPSISKVSTFACDTTDMKFLQLINAIKPCLVDSTLFEIERVAHSFTFPTPVCTLFFCALFTPDTGRRWGGVGRWCDCSVPAALDLAVASEWFGWLA